VAWFRGADGAELAVRELGAGRPLVLLHGCVSTGADTWMHTRVASLLAHLGHRVIIPDLRGHGDSAKPHDAAPYPPDVLTDDAFPLVEHLGLTEYDFGGYSLDGRTVIRALVHGATPDRAVLAGVGLDELVHTAGRGGRVLPSSRHEPGDLPTRIPRAGSRAASPKRRRSIRKLFSECWTRQSTAPSLHSLLRPSPHQFSWQQAQKTTHTDLPRH
jgi:pimeloyl-ACP methyl ester carboxylesterase